MAGFLGEIACKVDAKGRFAFPSRFAKQMPAESNSAFVINRGMEKCLNLHTLPKWNGIAQEMQKLNEYNPKERKFLRQFMRGATELTLDGTGRLLLPKRLIEYAGIKKNIVVVGFFDRLEIWDEETYENYMNIDADDYATLANDVLGNTEKQIGEQN